MTTIDEATKAADWYQKMALAMRARDNCLNAITRWQGKLAEAEQHIADLAGQVVPDQYKIAAAAVVRDPAGVDPSWGESAK